MRRIVRGLLRPTARYLFPVETHGLEKVPTSGGIIVAANHISFWDSALLMGVLPRPITFVGKAEYMDSWKTRYLFPAAGMIPIDRSGGKASLSALEAAAEVLNRGEIFGIFPEGTRSRDGYLHKGRTGVARLSIGTGAPIVPLGIRGTDSIQTPDDRFPHLFTGCEFHFGDPIRPDRFAGREGDGRIFRELTDEVMFEIRDLSGQEYVHVYAGESLPVVAPDTTAREVLQPVG